MGEKNPLQLFCQIQTQTQMPHYISVIPNTQEETWWKVPVNRNRPHVFSEPMKISPRMTILKVG